MIVDAVVAGALRHFAAERAGVHDSTSGRWVNRIDTADGADPTTAPTSGIGRRD